MRMSIGTILIALGAILTFLVDGLGLRILGGILMLIGAVWLIVHFYYRNKNRKNQAAYDGRQPRMRVPPTDESAVERSLTTGVGASATAATRSPLTPAREVVVTPSAGSSAVEH